MRLLNIGFNNVVVGERVISIISPDSAPVRKLIETARERGSLIDATCGRRTRAVIITDTNHIILSSLQPETIAERFKQKKKSG